jgi:imidazolonepropionase-like amidohydrolase
LDSVQYTRDEIAAICEEARNRKTYVAAHAYNPQSIRLAVENGVHTIEHGNLIDQDAAKSVAAAGAVMVPTLVTYYAMDRMGSELGLPLANREKNRVVLKAGLESLEIARAAGVVMGFGTDLIGETQVQQNQEFAIRAEAQSAKDILTSMYLVGARLCRLEGKVGVLAEGAFGDIVIANKDPLEDIKVLADWQNTLSHVIKNGIVVPRA